MIEAYAFLAAFAVQILATSVLYPAWFVSYVRSQTAHLPLERLAELYPGVDIGQVQERFLKRYRALHTGIAVLGLLLLAGLCAYLQNPDWDGGKVTAPITVYFLVSQAPLALVIGLGVRFNKEHRHASEQRKRKAELRPRGVFDFVSPFAVFLAVLSYLLFAAFVFYIQQRPFPGFAGYINIGVVTLVYVLNAVVVYTMLYGRRRKPFESPTARLHSMNVGIKSSVYSCIAVVVYLSITFSLGLLDLRRWDPLALSVFFTLCSLLASLGVMAPPREPEVDELSSHPAR